MRVAIIGGGVIGCAAARELARRGAEVVVLERGRPGGAASSAAAGILGAQLESHGPGELFERFVRARQGFAALATALREETGLDVGYRVSGALRVAFDDAEEAELGRAVAWQRGAGLNAELVRGDRVASIEPELAKDARAAAYFPDEAQVNPPSLVRALARAANQAGATIRSGATVVRLLGDASRCRGALLDDGPVEADATVLAAGSWSSSVTTSSGEAAARVRPARGQMVLLDERPPRLRAIVMSKDAYAVPRGDGRVLCGSTVELVGFQEGVTAGGVAAILGGALKAVPSLARAFVADTWSSFRPQAFGASSSGLDAPLVGPSEIPRLFLATGHYRNGVLLAQVTAEAIAEAVLGPRT